MPAQARGTIFVKVTFVFSILFRPTRNAGVFRAGENGERSQDVCRRPAAQTSGVKNIVSTIFFTLSQYAARKSGTRGEIREGVFSDGITGCLPPSHGTNIRSKKYRIDDIFYSFTVCRSQERHPRRNTRRRFLRWDHRMFAAVSRHKHPE